MMKYSRLKKSALPLIYGHYGRVLAGVQVPKGEQRAFKTFLNGLGYPFCDETENPAYTLFLG